MTAPKAAGVQRAPALWQGLGVSPRVLFCSPLPRTAPPQIADCRVASLLAMTAPEAAGVQRAQPFGRGLGGPQSAHLLPPSLHSPTPDCRVASAMTAPEAAGVQRAQPFGRGLGVSPRVLICSPLPCTAPGPRLPRRFTPRNDRAGGSRRPEGAALWQGSGGVPQSAHLLPPSTHSPTPDCRVASLLAMTAPEAAGVQRAPPFGRGLGVGPSQAGSPEGCNPTGRRYGGCLLPPFQEGGRGIPSHL